MKISDTFKDASGKLWLTLGTLSSGITTLETNFRLQNIGDLCTFAKIKIIPKGIQKLPIYSIPIYNCIHTYT